MTQKKINHRFTKSKRFTFDSRIAKVDTSLHCVPLSMTRWSVGFAIYFLDSWLSHDNRSNGGSALRRFYAKQAK